MTGSHLLGTFVSWLLALGLEQVQRPLGVPVMGRCNLPASRFPFHVSRNLQLLPTKSALAAPSPLLGSTQPLKMGPSPRVSRDTPVPPWLWSLEVQANTIPPAQLSDSSYFSWTEVERRVPCALSARDTHEVPLTKLGKGVSSCPSMW